MLTTEPISNDALASHLSSSIGFIAEAMKRLRGERPSGSRHVGDAPYRARKVGGSYNAYGTVVCEFTTLGGKERVVFEFDEPAGMLHIFDVKQVERV